MIRSELGRPLLTVAILLLTATLVAAGPAPTAAAPVPTPPAAPTLKPAPPADDSAKVFSTRYGPEMAKVLASPDTADDLALAANLVAEARGQNVPLPLVRLLCEKAYGLAAKHTDGFATAAGAMMFLITKVPDAREDAQEKIIALYQSRYSKARGPENAKAGEALVDLLVRYGDARVEARRFDDAVTLYRRAMNLAPALRGVNREELKAKLDLAMTRQGFMKQIERLQADLKAAPANMQIRDEIVRLYLVELDDPKAAAKALDLEQKDLATKFVLLAGMSVERLPERALIELGEWYRKLADQSSPQGRVRAAARAKGYYERFLELHPAADEARTAAAKGLAEVDDVLARAVVASPKIEMLRYKDFEDRYARFYPPEWNLAGKGQVSASSSFGTRTPGDVLTRGQRADDVWYLGVATGTFDAQWTPPVRGRYILVFARKGTPNGNPWGDAAIAINGARPQKLDGMTDGRMLLVDLGFVVPITSVHLDIRGKTYPGLSGIEIHARQATPKAGA